MLKHLAIAAGEIGYSRWNDPKQGTKYGRWYAEVTNSPYFGTNGVPYCAMFVSWVLDRAGIKVHGFPTASCVTIDGATKGKQLSNKRSAQAGDIVLFDWDGDGSPDHVGFVELNCGSYIQTIEGNTSSGSNGSQSNGGGVYRRTRDWSVVHCVIRINGGSEPVKPSKKIAVDGYWGEDTTAGAQKLFKTPVDRLVSSQSNYWKSKYKACTGGWEWKDPKVAQGSQLIASMQAYFKRLGFYRGKIDGLAGREFWQAMEMAAGYEPDELGLEAPSNTVKWLQRKINAGQL